MQQAVGVPSSLPFSCLASHLAMTASRDCRPLWRCSTPSQAPLPAQLPATKVPAVCCTTAKTARAWEFSEAAARGACKHAVSQLSAAVHLCWHVAADVCGFVQGCCNNKGANTRRDPLQRQHDLQAAGCAFSWVLDLHTQQRCPPYYCCLVRLEAGKSYADWAHLLRSFAGAKVWQPLGLLQAQLLEELESLCQA